MRQRPESYPLSLRRRHGARRDDHSSMWAALSLAKLGR
ncbi:hypothetical protein KL86PLE_40614 [uncultured Pleomorphomonas sp.]|uniref:Uncharacterized protein n=1 Tax=uncultured Pleomorphomonas sp. TaxID=442121 RepID=A0A212LHF6_9HYPH|nr:hypothetical protein KL86PLE_40614 [uncultured Pleomorphomonas sp.]